MNEKLRSAYLRFSARDLAGAERLCGEVLGAEPGHAGALHLMGLVRLAGGRAREAIPLLARATEANPFDAAAMENLGLAHLAAGEPREAEAALRRAIGLGAGHATVFMRLGLALALQNRTVEAIAELEVAAHKAPQDPDVQLNLGNALAAAGQLAQAEARFREALALRPDHMDAHYNLGTLLGRMGRHEEAIAVLRGALTLAPDSADLHNNLGLACEQLGRLAEAERSYRAAIAADPRHVHAHNNLGNVLRAQGRLEEAAASCEAALALRADFTDALINLGNVRVDQGRLGEAQALYERALQADPGDGDALRNLGLLCRIQGESERALACLRRALELDPRRALLHADLGTLFLELGEVEAAEREFGAALALEPGNAEFCYGLAESLKLAGRLEEAAAHYERALAAAPGHVRALNSLVHVRQHLCAWEGSAELWERLRGMLAEGRGADISPFTLLSTPATAEEQLACARAWVRKAVAPFAAARERGFVFDFSQRGRRERLRIGYLSWGFHRHATAHLTAELFELHDRSRFEVSAYDCGPEDDSSVRQRIRQACEHFVDLSRTPHLEAAHRIHGDGIDILVDLTGYTLGGRPEILALRPAPVLVNWLGYPGTFGAEWVDCLIADAVIVPPGAERFYAERQVLRLPHCYQVSDRKREIAPRVPDRAQAGLPPEGFVFCCFNQAYKISPQVFELWMRILGAVPGSVLWLAQANPWACANLRRAAQARAIAPERLVFAPRKPLPDYLVQYRLADLALDTFPYTSHTLASDALWMGCPLVTCPGETFASRVAASILRAAGLPELVAGSFLEYEQLAVELATVPGKLDALRARLRASRDTCPLFDTPRFVRELEALYERMFETFLAQRAAGR
jgi:predicted O-linked N-acetylglucosamine transferase (SPINDLY family)